MKCVACRTEIGITNAYLCGNCSTGLKEIAALRAEVETLTAETALVREDSRQYECDVHAALVDTGIDMGDGENPQDTITAIGLLIKERDRLRRATLKVLNNVYIAECDCPMCEEFRADPDVAALLKEEVTG